MAKQLVIDLVGRICLVKRGKWGNEEEEENRGLWAVFLDIPPDRERELREHRPLLSVPLSMVKSQEVADKALLTSATFVKPLNKARRLVDQLGIFPIARQDMTISGAAAGAGTVRIRDVANLNAIIASLPPPDNRARIEPEILRKTPWNYGVVARLKLPRSAHVTAITEDRSKKVFWPGGYKQRLATYVRCEIPFANDLKPPVLHLKKFGPQKPGGSSRFDYLFDAQKYGELTMTMSNLCSCIGEVKYVDDYVADDPEFAVYYRLVSGGLTQEPVPTIPVTRGAHHIPVCYFMAQAAVS